MRSQAIGRFRTNFLGIAPANNIHETARHELESEFAAALVLQLRPGSRAVFRQTGTFADTVQAFLRSGIAFPVQGYQSLCLHQEDIGKPDEGHTQIIT